MRKLTDRQITGLRPKAVRYEVWDGDGFGVRVTPKGVKSFVLVYHFEGHPRRLTLGRYRSANDVKAGRVADGVTFLTLSQARRAAETARERIVEGFDPGVEKIAHRATERAAETVAELIDDYLRLYANPRKRSAAEDQRQLVKDVLPRWGRRKASSIMRKDVQTLLDAVAARGAPIGANRLLAVVRRMFNFALAREVVLANPCAGIERPAAERRRERMLAMKEISTFWRGLDRSDASLSVRIVLKLLLVTAQRRSEVAGISLEELDEAEGLWIIPGGRTKNDNPHVVPLSSLAKELIQAAKVEAARIYGRPLKRTDYLFPSPRKRDEERLPITPGALTQSMARNAKHIGKRISPHDLRRTAHTHMGGEGVGSSRFVRDRIINHTDRTPGQSYDLHEYLKEKRDALNAWSAVLQGVLPETVTEDGKVVALHGGGDG